jgi:hypothetical protein
MHPLNALVMQSVTDITKKRNDQVQNLSTKITNSFPVIVNWTRRPAVALKAVQYRKTRFKGG